MKAFILFFTICATCLAQNKNFIDLNYIETSAEVDTLVIPDKIFLEILITEKDTKGKISVEDQEVKMANKLSSLDIEISKQLYLNDLSSNFEKYFLRKLEVLKAKSFTLIVFDAKTAGRVITELEKINISNVNLSKTEYAEMERLKLELKSKAIIKAKKKATYMAEPLGQKVGRAIFISDRDDVSRVLASRVAGIKIKGSGIRNQQELAVPEIEFQKIEVKSSLNVKFVLE